MTKKQKILDLLKDAEWQESPISEKWRLMTTIHQESMRKNGLNATIEYGDKWTDLHYLKRVLEKEGYRVMLGSWCTFVYKES